jgi:hypothetical protein
LITEAEVKHSTLSEGKGLGCKKRSEKSKRQEV